MNDHLLRKIDRFVDLSEVRAHLEPYYSEIGRPSIDPELMIRMLIVGWILIPLASAMPLRSVAIGAGVGGRVCHSSRARQGGVIRTKRAARTKRRIEVKRQLFLEAGVVGPSEYMTSVDVRPSNQRTLITEAGKRHSAIGYLVKQMSPRAGGRMEGVGDDARWVRHMHRVKGGPVLGKRAGVSRSLGKKAVDAWKPDSLRDILAAE